MSENRERDHRDPDHPGRRPHGQRRKKNTRDWCRGKQGVSHQLEVRLSKHVQGRPCHTAPEWMRGPWWCRHERACTGCGKILTPFLDWRECPDLPDELRPDALAVLDKALGLR